MAAAQAKDLRRFISGFIGCPFVWSCSTCEPSPLAEIGGIVTADFATGNCPLGQWPRSPNVRFGSLADICSAKRHVRFTPNSGHVQCNSVCPLCANSGLMHRSKQHRYSITSSTMERTPAGIVRPSAFAVVRLITNSNLVDCITGRSAGLAPLRMLPL